MKGYRRIAGPKEASVAGRPWGRWALYGLAALGLVVLARRLLWSPAGAPAASPAVAESAHIASGRPKNLPARAAEKAAPTAAEPALGPVPASLSGTDEDGALRVDDRGELLVGPEILAFFDYFLAASGEESAAAIRARILKRIREKLKEPAAGQASQLLDKYLAYREATRTIKAGAEGDIQARLDALRRLRREHFGAGDADKLFGVEERATAVAIAQQRVQRDPDLSPEERKRRLDELEAQLPEDVKKARQAALGSLRQREDEQALRAAGATDEEIQRHRVDAVGQEAADRLKDLDQQRAAWKKRVAAFQAERDAIVRSQPDSAARDTAIQKLLNDSFSPEERLRIKALDAIAERAGR